MNRQVGRAFAHAAVESGASLVIGHGPHVLRAAEWRGDALIFYSSGNLLTYGPFNQREPNNRGAIACASIDAAGRVADAVLRPTWQVSRTGQEGPLDSRSLSQGHRQQCRSSRRTATAAAPGHPSRPAKKSTSW